MKISEEKRKKISEHMLAFLYSNTPKPLFTSFIAKEAARDEEFVKKLLLELKNKNLVVEIKRNPKGKPYLRRSRWKLSDVAYQAYNDKQSF
jgi:DNA-binding IscR family transcriptional regulator